MLLYKCTSCQEFIQVTKARLTCSTCSPPITLCANCYVVQDYPPKHPDGASHSLSVYQHSGYLPAPPPPPVRTQSVSGVYKAALVSPRRRPVSAVPDTEVPPRKPPRPTKQPEVQPEVGAGEPVSRPGSSQPSTPLPPDTPQQSTEQDREQQQQHKKPPQPRQYPQDQQPPPPQRPQLEQTQSQQSQYQYQYHQEYPQHQQPQQHQQQYQPSGWTYFFNQDMTPTPCFSALIKEFFHHLDLKRTGLLSPETCSEYIDACGAAPSHNVWKASRARNPRGYDVADRELADHYTSYGIDFVLHPRTPASSPTASPFNPRSILSNSQHVIMEHILSSVPSVSGNQKPMLTLHGWTSLNICGALINPSGAWGDLNRAMRNYRLPLWSKWGDIPREMLPSAPHQPEVERVRIMHEGARINAERELDAVKARLMIEKQGRQAALDLLDDRRYVYR
ncbi:uncharacterized protein N7482_002230 [Penicillium canariense]|uniref:Uncharacterized protein n=1 Tax=Penicillium canariense TaxID=189055 RepID=A0A9W9IGM2_9EURO|nr:uncharacterized protein N7482_002230 [Penicillium canariense]KAJ5176353.1 hypothetical protein N7482_002230 [Penicillium canariense]